MGLKLFFSILRVYIYIHVLILIATALKWTDILFERNCFSKNIVLLQRLF